MRQRFLDEIGQYLPPTGRVLDIGCGFGLFSLYFASTRPSLRVRGFDLNANRILRARRAAEQLGVRNVDYDVRDAREYRRGEQFDAAYMLDLLHHIPRSAAEPLLRAVAASLNPGGVLLLKDVDTRPAYKRMFTRVLDLAMDPHTPVAYWPAAELQRMLERLGFCVYRHKMIDMLPYPHVLYICLKQS
jgi:2-polyprenyl-3-methyl-5-hydroxy-6-metoxy-1,4-benzoquinol methylase